MTTTKSFTEVTIKDATKGLIEAVFSTFDVVDLDGDVTLKGAFTEGAPVVISAYGHKSHVGALPVGKGTIHEVDGKAVLRGKFLLNTTHGRDTWETVKALSEDDLQEWSYSLDGVVSRRGQVDGKAVRIIEKVGLVKEVSPVLQGAGIGTRTIGMKSADTKQLAFTLARLLGEAGAARWETGRRYVSLDDFDIDDQTAVFCIHDYSVEPRERYRVQVAFERTDTDVTLGDDETLVEYTTVYLPKGAKFAEHTDAALRGVKELVHMAVERLALRAAEGKSVTEQVSAYDQLVAELAPLKSALDALTTTSQSPTTGDDLRHEYARFVATTIA